MLIFSEKQEWTSIYTFLRSLLLFIAAKTATTIVKENTNAKTTTLNNDKFLNKTIVGLLFSSRFVSVSPLTLSDVFFVSSIGFDFSAEAPT